MADVTGVSAAQLVSSNSSEFIEELNQLVRPALWPWALLTTLVVAFFTQGITWLSSVVLIAGLGVVVTLVAVRARHKVTVEYEVEGLVADWHASVRGCWPEIAQLGGVWRVAQQGATQTTYQRKINAGAGQIVNRNRVMVATSPHSRVLSNIGLPTFRCGKHSLAFLPDHILVRSGNKWGELNYSDLSVSYRSQRFIEDGGVPRDSQQVGTTWKYVNKSGGPDRRFNNNRQLPVMLYGEVELMTPTGLRWMLQLSRPDVASAVAAVLRAHPSLPAVER